MPQTPARAAASLTFEAASAADPSGLAAALKALGLRATFYLSATDLLEDLPAWRLVMDSGHEIGAFPLREATDARGVMANWTLQAVQDDVDACLSLFDEVLGIRATASALEGDLYLCAEGTEGMRTVSYLPVFQSRFETIRVQANGRVAGERRGMLPTVPILRVEQAKQEVEAAIREGSWAVFRVRPQVTEPLPDFWKWLADQQERIQIGTVSEVAAGSR